MRVVYISGLASYLPGGRQAVEDAVVAGLYDGARVETDGFSSVTIEERMSQVDMAVAAAAKVVRQEDRSTASISTIYLSSIHRSGHKHLWPAVSRLHRELGLPSGVRTIGISQGCIGAFAAISVAYDMLRHGVQGDHIVVGSDRFSGSSFDRYNSDLGTLYGDAAAAIRLTATPGPVRLAMCVVESEPRLEEMYRAETEAAEGPGDHEIKEAKRAYLERVGRDHFFELFTEALHRLKTKIHASTNLEQHPANILVYPNVGAGLSARLYEEVLGSLGNENHWSYGRSLGHTGTVDQILGLDHLVQQGRTPPGTRVLLIGAGNGLSLAAVLVEFS